MHKGTPLASIPRTEPQCHPRPRVAVTYRVKLLGQIVTIPVQVHIRSVDPIRAILEAFIKTLQYDARVKLVPPTPDRFKSHPAQGRLFASHRHNVLWSVPHVPVNQELQPRDRALATLCQKCPGTHDHDDSVDTSPAYLSGACEGTPRQKAPKVQSLLVRASATTSSSHVNQTI